MAATAMEGREWCGCYAGVARLLRPLDATSFHARAPRARAPLSDTMSARAVSWRSLAAQRMDVPSAERTAVLWSVVVVMVRFGDYRLPELK